MKRFSFPILALLIQVAFSTVAFGQINPESDYRFIVRHSRKVLDVVNASTENGAVIQQYTLHGAPNQIWRVEPMGDAYYKIVGKQSGKVITLTTQGLIVQYEWVGGDNQQWRIEPAGPDSYYVLPKLSGKCLEVLNNSTEDRGRVQAHTCNG